MWQDVLAILQAGEVSAGSFKASKKPCGFFDAMGKGPACA
jgi:hypothetical protein